MKKILLVLCLLGLIVQGPLNAMKGEEEDLPRRGGGGSLASLILTICTFGCLYPFAKAHNLSDGMGKCGNRSNPEEFELLQERCLGFCRNYCKDKFGSQVPLDFKGVRCRNSCWHAAEKFALNLCDEMEQMDDCDDWRCNKLKAECERINRKRYFGERGPLIFECGCKDRDDSE